MPDTGSHALAALPFGAVMARLEALAGFAASEILMNRLVRASALVARLPMDRPGIDHPDWAALLDAVTVQETRMFRAAAQLDQFRRIVLPDLVAGAKTIRAFDEAITVHSFGGLDGVFGRVWGVVGLH